MATLVAMATVLEKNLMTFYYDTTEPVLMNFIVSVYMIVVQNLAKKVMI